MTLLDPQADASDSGWNIIQSKSATGAGIFSNKCFSEATASHLHFRADDHTDLITAIYSKKFRFIGLFILIILYFTIIFCTFQLGPNGLHNYGCLLACSLGLWFFIYVFVNAGLVSGILAVTGIPLPFMSYKGTVMMTLMAAFGIVMSIHTHR